MRISPSIVRLALTCGTAIAFAACGAHSASGGGGLTPATTADSPGRVVMAATSATMAFTEYPVPSANSNPNGITAGPDGALWFAEDAEGASKIGRITTAGAVTEYNAGLDPNSGPFDIKNGPNGQLWFTESGFTDTCGTIPNGIGSITTSGVVTNYTSGFTTCAGPYGITAGADGNLWFTEYTAGVYGKMTTSGSVSEFSNLPTSNSAPAMITSGADGNVWFSEAAGNNITRATIAANPPAASEFADGNGPYGITQGPDGNTWFTDCSGSGTADAIGKIDALGNITYYTANLTQGSCPVEITAGPDGSLWFTEYSGNNIGRITVTGTITEYTIPTANSLPYFIATGSDGSLWFTESGANQIGRLNPAAVGGLATPSPSPSPACFDPDDAHQNPAHPNQDKRPDSDCTKGPPAPKVRHTPKPPGPKPHPTPKPTPTPNPH